jgi:hydroxymethylpyrimidine pyrophosphatase-like HAD family hydrolase/predicted phosphodiesterase
MKIALISDIHGNIFALDAVLDDAALHGADTYVFVGDYVCNMTFPNEAIERLRAVQENHPTYIVNGNKETLMQSMTQEEPSTWVCDQLGSVYQTFRELTPDNLEWLLSLPETATIALPNNKSLFVQHIFLPLYMDKNGKRYTRSTLNNTDYFRKEHLRENFSHEDYLKQAEKEFSQDCCAEQLSEYVADIIVSGHTHLQWYAFVGNKLLINPGSCGQPDDGSPLAPYTLLSVTEHGVAVEERRACYDVENAVAAARKTAIYKNGSDFMEACLFGIQSGYDYISELRETAQRLSDEYGKPVPKGQAVDNDIWRLAVREVLDAYGIKAKQNIRLVVTDLDGTLLRSDKTVTAYTAEILNRCREKGIKAAVATGRSKTHTLIFLNGTVVDALCLNNGTYITIGDETLKKLTLAPDTQKSLLFDLQHTGTDIEIHMHDGETSRAEEDNGLCMLNVICKDKIIPFDILNKYSDIKWYTYNNNSGVFIQVQKTSKLNAVLLLAEKWDIELHEIAAFGDDYNDIEMLKNCGVGVAVANALDDVKVVADYVCDSNDDDGVAKWLEENVL